VVGAALFRLFHPKADLQSRNSLSEEEPVRDPCQGAARELVDGHTLGPVITKLEKLTAVETRRIHVDKGYRGHNHSQKFRVWINGQVRRVTAPIRHEMKRRAAIEPVMGHVKAEHRMDRNYLEGRDGDRINAVLAAAGDNIGLLQRWLKRLLRALIAALSLNAQFR
jgi:IS5 family transposase